MDTTEPSDLVPSGEANTKNPVPRNGRIASSPGSQLILLLLTSLYALGAAAALLVSGSGGATEQWKLALLVHGACHATVALVCAIALVAVRRKRKAADSWTALAVLTVTFFALRAFASAMVTGFHFYHLIELMLVLPAVALLFARLALPGPHRKPDQATKL